MLSYSGTSLLIDKSFHIWAELISDDVILWKPQFLKDPVQTERSRLWQRQYFWRNAKKKIFNLSLDHFRLVNFWLRPTRADPEHSSGGTGRGGESNVLFCLFFKTLHWIKKILAANWGGRPLSTFSPPRAQNVDGFAVIGVLCEPTFAIIHWHMSLGDAVTCGSLKKKQTKKSAASRCPCKT